MAGPRVLSIGQCGFDSAAIERLFDQAFSADVESVDSSAAAAGRLKSDRFDLVLINRRLDADGSSGIEILERLHQHSPDVPMMLVSDRKEAQEEAMSKGALQGFGKSALRTPETAAKIRVALGRSNGGDGLELA